MRLQSFLSKSGVASRRKCAELVQEGKVKVNGEVVTEPGKAIEPDQDVILYRGKPVVSKALAYYMFHKPLNVITTAKDPQNRRTVVEFFKDKKERVFPVGRLDRNTTGLLLVTNDGDLANALMHPRYGVTKRYAVLIDKSLSKAQLDKFKRGLRIEGDKKTAACQITAYGKQGGHFAYEVTLKEGKNRQIRKMMEILGCRVKALHRFEYGPLDLGNLKLGASRPLKATELKALREFIQ
jgi:23S rRNA pseudouridine2605 synthase